MPGKPIPIREADNETFELRLIVDNALADGQIDAREAAKIRTQVHLVEPLVHESYIGVRAAGSILSYAEVSPQIHREFGANLVIQFAEWMLQRAREFAHDHDDDPDGGAPALEAA